MDSLKELSEILRKKGTPYFEEQDLTLFINEIYEKYNLSLHSYNSLTQEAESVRLEFSFLTNKAIYDFTLVNKTIYTTTFFLKEVILVNEEVNQTSRSLKIQIGDDSNLIYKAYINSDKINLFEYAKKIISEINKI